MFPSCFCGFFIILVFFGKQENQNPPTNRSCVILKLLGKVEHPVRVIRLCMVLFSAVATGIGVWPKCIFLAFVKLSSQECLLHSNVIHFNVLLSSPSLRLSFALHLFIAKVKGNNCTFRSNSRNCFRCEYIAYFQADLKRNFYCTFRTIYMTKLKTIYKLNYFKIAYLLIL